MALGNITAIWGDWLELASILVFFVGFYGVITNKSIFKSIVSIGVMEMAAIMFFLSIGFSETNVPPIGAEIDIYRAADPLPQALMITAIIMGVAIISVNLIMLITLYRKHSLTDWDNAKKMYTE